MKSIPRKLIIIIVLHVVVWDNQNSISPYIVLEVYTAESAYFLPKYDKALVIGETAENAVSYYCLYLRDKLYTMRFHQKF